MRKSARFFRAAWPLIVAGALAGPLPAGVRALYRIALIAPPAIVLTLAAAPKEAEAGRFGGGRSFGFRGSRGFGGFSRRSSFGRRGAVRGYRRGGFGLPFLMGMGLGGFGFGGFGGILLYPILLLFLLRILRGRS